MTTDTAATASSEAPLLDERADDSAVWLSRREGIPAVWARYTELVSPVAASILSSNPKIKEDYQALLAAAKKYR